MCRTGTLPALTWLGCVTEASETRAIGDLSKWHLLSLTLYFIFVNECRVEAESVCIYNSRSTTACFLNASALPRSFSESRWWMKCLWKLPNTCSFHWPSCKAMPLYFQSSVLNGINFRWQSTAWLLCTCAGCLHSYALSETWDMKLRLQNWCSVAASTSEADCLYLALLNTWCMWPDVLVSRVKLAVLISLTRVFLCVTHWCPSGCCLLLTRVWDTFKSHVA